MAPKLGEISLLHGFVFTLALFSVLVNISIQAQTCIDTSSTGWEGHVTKLLTHLINKILCNCASKCLKNVTHSNTPKKKRWFNLSCSRLKSEVRPLARSLSKVPTNTHTRANFYWRLFSVVCGRFWC